MKRRESKIGTETACQRKDVRQIRAKDMTVKWLASEAVCCLVIVVFALILGMPRYRLGINYGDEGILAYGSERVLVGQVPHRDFYCNHPPLSFYTGALMFKLFGTSLVALRTLGLSMYVLIALLIYAMARHLSGCVMSLAAAMPVLVLGMPLSNFVPFASVHGIVTILLSALFVMRAVATGRRWWAFLAGLTTALLIFSRQDYGFYLIAAVLLYALALKLASSGDIDRPHPGRILYFWMVGIAALMLPAGVYWLVSGAVGDMFEQLVVFPLTTYSATSSIPMPSFSFDQSMRESILTGLFYLPPVVGGLAAVWLLACLVRRRFYMKHTCLAFVVVLSILFYHQVLVRSDIYHLVDALPPFFVLCAWWLGAASNVVGSTVRKVWNRDGNARWMLFTAPAVVLIVVGAIGIWFLSHTKPVFLKPLETPVKEVLLERAGVFIEPKHAYIVEKLIEEVQRHTGPGRSILSLPYEPIFYFLSGRHNPTERDYFWPGDMSEQDYQTFIKQARNDPPAVVLIFRRLQMQRYAPAVIDYVNAEYKIDFDLGWVTFYLPLQDSGFELPRGHIGGQESLE